MSNLVIEIGNTALKAAWTEGTTLGKTFRYQGEKFMDFILNVTSKQRPEIMTVASARQISEKEKEILEGECRHLLMMDKESKDVILSYGLPEYLSCDRAASLIAIRYMFSGKPCSIFDFGTTLTIDFVSSEGKYEGGSISPGFLTRFKALNRYSRSLPLLNIPERIEEPGTSIAASIEDGVVLGIKFEIEGYMRTRQDNINVFTGGDAAYFAGLIKQPIFIVNNLVLKGLALITDEYEKADSH